MNNKSNGKSRINRACQTWLTVILVIVVLICVYTLMGSSKSANRPAAVMIGVVGVKTNAGELTLQLGITNATTKSLLLGVRSMIYQAGGRWVTNYSVRTAFVGFAGPGSMTSDIALLAGAETNVTLSQLKMTHPFQMEFVCFPQRGGVLGLVDRASDKFRSMQNNSGYETYAGKSFYIVTPLIPLDAEKDAPSNKGVAPRKFGDNRR